MIGHLEGTIIATGTESVILSAGGVGYRIFVTPDALARAEEGSAAAFWTHLAVRENALDLYGFAAKDELRFFELLLGVSGIGPKSALGVMSVATLETLRSAIASGDATHLTKVGGIGKKTAEKIVLELRDKVGPAAASDADRADLDAMEALVAMGYSAGDAREALKRVPRDITGSNERLREALRGLGS
ncbi:MAG TPA: Holliday junction branch migration protein RuvA [Candidatus Paceibacterota bacterium]|nr:Holliday junction branch migration protein RuvA [Candidatus Paceibacterota bacterium]